MKDSEIGQATHIHIDPSTAACELTAEQLVHRLWTEEKIDGSTPMNGQTRKLFWQALLTKVMGKGNPSETDLHLRGLLAEMFENVTKRDISVDLLVRVQAEVKGLVDDE